MARFHIKAVAPGDTLLVSLGITLLDKSTTNESYEESVIKTNPEIMGLVSKKRLALISEDDFENEKRLAEQKKNLETTLEDALEDDQPATQSMVVLFKRVEAALGRLGKLIEGTSTTPEEDEKPNQAPPDLTAAIPDDGLSLPMAPPPGLKPQVPTMEYLKKSGKERKEFLKTCRDITILRDVALFEGDQKLKMFARKQAKSAEAQAEKASEAAQAVAQ